MTDDAIHHEPAAAATDPAASAKLRGLVEHIDEALHRRPSTVDGSTIDEGVESAVGAEPSPPTDATDSDAGTLHVLFEIAGSSFAVPAAGLAEIEPFEPPMPIPGVPPWVLGIDGRDGETVSVVDLARFLGFSSLTVSELSRTLVVTDPRDRRRVLTGLAVDAVVTHEWLPASDGRHGAVAALDGRLGRFTRRVVDLGQRALAVLDLDALLLSRDFLDRHP